MDLNVPKVTERKIFLIFCFLLIFVSHALSQPLFTPVTSKVSGVTFDNKLVETPETNIITYEYYYNGGGVAAGDFNNDGLIDLYFTANLVENKLYLNQGNFKFLDITKTAGVAGRRGWKTGVSVADVNGDGYLDIYVCYSGDVDRKYRANQLFINNGNLTFTDRAVLMGVADEGHTTHAAFFDLDRDGDLDLYVLNHNIKNLRNFDAAFVKKMVDPDAGDRLYENVNGIFKDITSKAGIISNPLGYGLGVNVADINNDGWPDIYVTNDYVEEDYLYINNHDGTFTEKLKNTLQHISNFSMGVDIADINNDGLLDIFTLDMLPEDNRRQKLLYAPDNYELYNNMVQNGFHHQLMRNMLQLNNGNGSFSEIGQVSGVAKTDWSWAALIADYDNDGHKDLFVTNGYGRDMINRDFIKFYANERLKHLQGKTDNKMFQMLQSIKKTPLHNYIFKNKGDLTFDDKSTLWGFEEENYSHGALYADLDNDGDLDLVVNKMNQEAGIYRNQTIESKSGKNYIKIKLKGNNSNAFAIGARIEVYADANHYMVENFPVHGFQSSMSGPIHLGIGEDAIDSVKVRWPDGSFIKLTDGLNVNSTMNIKQENTSAKVTTLEAKQNIFTQTENSLPFIHQEMSKNDFKIQPLIPNMVSYHGPKMAKGDVNNDGIEDIYICGAKDKSGELLIGHPDGQFTKSNQPDFVAGAQYEDYSAILFDADGDGDLDLYVVSGGYASTSSELDLQDRFYLNGGGTFFEKDTRIPKETHSGSQVLSLDFDNDGDLDLFIGGRVVPGQYPKSPGSLLLVNDGKGHFTDETARLASDFMSLGLVTDAKWVDLDQDGRNELIVCGEWMPFESFTYDGNQFIKTTRVHFIEKISGWWNTLEVADIDQDGDMDLIAGNWGLNAPFRATKEEPMEMYFSDFDKNGYIDPMISYYIQGKAYPMATRDELTDQIVSLRQRYVTYDSYANATLEDVFSKEELSSAPKLYVDCLETVLFENVNGQMKKKSLPLQAQFAPVHAIIADDFDKDGHLDLLLAGNTDQVRIKIGKTDANVGCLLLGDGKGQFEYCDQLRSGLNMQGCIRSLLKLEKKGGQKFIIAGRNNGSPILLSY